MTVGYTIIKESNISKTVNVELHDRECMKQFRFKFYSVVILV